MTKQIAVNKDIYLSPVKEGDKSAFIKWLNEKEISDNTLVIPFPYTEADAEWFINHIKTIDIDSNKPTHLAIRNQTTNELIGMIALNNNPRFGDHSTEIGYWLAKPFWGKGIMTDVVKSFSTYALKELNYIRLYAPVFGFNKASQKVLLKSNFVHEGTQRKAYKKKGVIFDAELYALVV